MELIILEVYLFEYEADGNLKPIKIIFNNYKYQFIRGKCFRNYFSEAALNVQFLLKTY
ncbi:MAG: hypothetical protein ACJA1D_000718 [Polaribacter sp.]